MTTDEFEKRIYDLNQLLEISRSLNSTLDVNQLLDSLLYTVMGHLKVINAAVFLRDFFDSAEYRLHRNYKGYDFPHGFDPLIDADSPVIHYMNQNPGCHTLGDLSDRFPGDEVILVLQDILPSLIIPMVSKAGMEGIILVSEGVDSEIFAEEDKRFTQDIALFGAIAIHNSVLYEMASTDMMTRLKLRHFFLTMLEKTYNEAMKKGGSFAVIMLDIDHFKKLNDTYGHACGDIVIVKVASILRNSVRKLDIPARYGGEEFVILLQGANLEIARNIGERIRAEVGNIRLEYDDKQIRATISVGVAVFDSSIDFSPEAVVKRADVALYQSKESGRNLLTVSEGAR